MIMAAADEAGTGGLELLDCTRLLLPPLLLLPLPMAAALLLFDRLLSCLLFFLPDDRDDARDAVLPNDATELLDDIRRIMSGSVDDLLCFVLCWLGESRIESNRIGSNCICRKVPELVGDVTRDRRLWAAIERRYR